MWKLAFIVVSLQIIFSKLLNLILCQPFFKCYKYIIYYHLHRILSLTDSMKRCGNQKLNIPKLEERWRILPWICAKKHELIWGCKSWIISFRSVKWAAAWQNQQNDLCTLTKTQISKGIHPVWSVFAVHSLGS